MRRVALLRGVNVGGVKVPMATLKQVFEDEGAKNVVSYIQSGQVVFDGPAALNAKKLETAIEKQFKRKIAVTVRTHAQLVDVAKRNPYDDTQFVHVAFLIGKPKMGEFDQSSFAPEEFTVSRSEVFLYLPNGMGVSRLAPAFMRRIGNNATVRNWNTLQKLIELSS